MGAPHAAATPPAPILPTEFDPASLFLLKECQHVLKPRLTQSLRQLFVALTGFELHIIWHPALPAVCSAGFSRSKAAPPRQGPIRNGPSHSRAPPPEGGTTNRTPGPSMAAGSLHKPPPALEHGNRVPLVCPRAWALAAAGKPLSAVCQACQQQHWTPAALASDGNARFTGACGITSLRLPVRDNGMCPLTLVVQARVTRRPTSAFLGGGNASDNAASGPRPVPGRSAALGTGRPRCLTGSLRALGHQTPTEKGPGQIATQARFGAAARGDRARSAESPRLDRAEALLRLVVDDLEAHLTAYFNQANRNPGAIGEEDLPAENPCLQKKLRARIPATPATSASHPTPTRASHHLPDSTLLTEAEWAAAAAALHLSGRELQIVRDIFDNHTEHAMAADYGIADCTVHTHLERLYHKLAVTTRVALVLRVMTSCLYPDDPPV